MLHTSEGAVELELFDADAPTTVGNFTKLAGEGFYDGITFHRVIPDFMIQSLLTVSTAPGGPGYIFEDEFNLASDHPRRTREGERRPEHERSQFFIVTAEECPWLDGMHTVFGRVVSGQDVVDSICDVPRDARDRPTTPVTIDRVELST